MPNDKTFPKSSLYQVCNAFTMSLKKVRNEDDFFDADEHQSFPPVGLNTLGIKVFCKVISLIMKILSLGDCGQKWAWPFQPWNS